MITYICHNKNDKTGENLPCTNNRCETSICPSCGGRSDAISEIFWCPECQVPIYEKNCPVCGQEGKKLTSDVRPVFPEERLLLEIILEKPFAFEKDSVWNGNGNNYFVNGKKIKFSVKDLKNKDADVIRKQYEELKAQNTYQYFEKQMERFILCNKERYNWIVEEAKGYIRSMTENFDITDMFVSFSGGKDSTVTADLVTRALSNPQIMHILHKENAELYLLMCNKFNNIDHELISEAEFRDIHVRFVKEIKKLDKDDKKNVIDTKTQFDSIITELDMIQKESKYV